MQNFTLQQVQALVKTNMLNNSNTATKQAIQQAMCNKIASALNNNSATFASVTCVTNVALAAAHKKAGRVIVKCVSANVTLNANYTNSVNKSANITNFVASASVNNNTAFNNCVKHNANTNNYLLYATYNKVLKTCYYDVTTQQIVNKNYVAQFLTAAAANSTLNKTTTTHNKTNDTTHNVVVRTIALHNVVQLNVNKQQIHA